MESTSRSPVQDLHDSISRLNELADQAAQSVREIEELLEESGVGQAARVEIEPQSDGEGLTTTCLEYCQIGERYRIAVVWYAGDGDPVITPWLECVRDLKLDSIRYLPELISAIAEQVVSRVNEASESVRAADDVRTALRSASSEPENEPFHRRLFSR